MAFDEKLFRSNAAKENIPEADVQAALDEHYKNNKTEPTPIVETAKGMVDLFTAKHPTLGISPADVVMYAGGAGAAFAAGKKAIDLAGQGLSAAGSAVKNKIFGQAGSSVPPVNPTASTQALMATPDIAKPPAPINLSLQDATDRAAASFQLKTPVEKAEVLLGQDSPSAINRSVPPTMGPNQFTGSTPPGTFSSPAAPIGGMTSPAPTPSLTPEITGQAAAPAAPTDQKPKLTRVVGEAKIARDAEIARIANNPVEIADQPGMRQNYKKPVVPPINPETGKAWMGSSGYNYLASQIGHEKAPEAWKALYGEKNVPFKTVEADYAAARKLEGVPPKTKGGAFGTPENIPSFIKGKASPGFLGALAGLGLLGLAGTQKSKESMAKAGEAIQNIGIAPEALLRGKGDELGQLGGAYVNAGNYQYKAQLEDQLKTTKDANRRAELMSELNKIKAPFRK